MESVIKSNGEENKDNQNINEEKKKLDNPFKNELKEAVKKTKNYQKKQVYTYTKNSPKSNSII
jgi:hypothetical protein